MLNCTFLVAVLDRGTGEIHYSGVLLLFVWLSGTLWLVFLSVIISSRVRNTLISRAILNYLTGVLFFCGFLYLALYELGRVRKRPHHSQE